MSRRIISESGHFRYIRRSDLDQPFGNRLRILNGLDLHDFLEFNSANRHVFVYAHDGRILCVLVFDDKGDHFYINLLENNEVYEKECDEIKPAPNMIGYLESVSKFIGYSKITLDSIQQLVPYYERLGFTQIGRTVFDRNYGMLSSMSKPLGR